MIFVTSMEFSPSGRAVLSVSADSSARVTPIAPTRGGSLQKPVVFLVIFIILLAWFLGKYVFPDWHQGQSPETLLSGILSRLTSSSELNISGHDNNALTI